MDFLGALWQFKAVQSLPLSLSILKVANAIQEDRQKLNIFTGPIDDFRMICSIQSGTNSNRNGANLTDEVIDEFRGEFGMII